MYKHVGAHVQASTLLVSVNVHIMYMRSCRHAAVACTCIYYSASVQVGAESFVPIQSYQNRANVCSKLGLARLALWRLAWHGIQAMYAAGK